MSRLIALYDGQCEICQAGVSWIRALDRDGAIACTALQDGPVEQLHPELREDDCLAQLHVVETGTGRIHVGWDAVLRIAAELPALRGASAVARQPGLRNLGDRAYRWVAANRSQLSARRGGVCHSSRPLDLRRAAGARPFWTCYTLGMVLRLPLVAAVAARQQVQQVTDYVRTYRRRVELLPDRLELWFLGGVPADVVPLAFGEQFCAVWYRGALVDPGSTRMRRSLDRHLRRGQEVSAVTATHAHEEHVGNLEWTADRTGAPLYLPARIEQALRPAGRIPRSRAAVIGSPPSLTGEVEAADEAVPVLDGRLEVLAAPGHSPEHVVLWDAEERVLLVGDSFMGAYFSSPNADVDCRHWIRTLERLLTLDVSVMVEGHGHVHTLREDIPDVPGVVVRADPRAALTEKLEYLRWMADRLADAARYGAGTNAAVAMCFPWGRRWSWERLYADELARLSTGGGFSRHELVRSFHRAPGDTLPTLLEARIAP